MWPALWIGLALSAPPAEAESRLVEVAVRAKRAGDAALTRKALRGWATLRRHPQLPAGLEPEAADATAWAAGAGQLRIYGSRLPDRVRVGVDDPAALVGRLDVSIAAAGGWARLTRARVEAAGRNEYTLPVGDREILIEAVMTDYGPEVVLRRSILAPPSRALPPPKPAPKTAAAPPALVPGAPTAPAAPWWWIALGVACAGLAGVAIYQEAKR